MRRRELGRQTTPYVALFQWNSDIRQWVYDTWNVDKPQQDWVFVDNEDNPKIVEPAELDESDMKISSDKGLVCLQINKTTVFLFNAVSGKSMSLSPLGMVFERRMRRVCFLAFIPHAYSGKVFSLTRAHNGAVTYHILILGQNPHWRTLGYNDPHFPTTKSVFTNRSLFYAGRTREGSSRFIRFDVHEEVFSLIELPYESELCLSYTGTTLASFRGKPVIANRHVYEHSLRLWTFDEASSAWTNAVFSTSILVEGVAKEVKKRVILYFEGVSEFGEVLILSLLEPPILSLLEPPSSASASAIWKTYVVYFNPRRQTFIKFLIKGTDGVGVDTIWDYRETLWLLHG